jgi:hypothetical protein
MGSHTQEISQGREYLELLGYTEGSHSVNVPSVIGYYNSLDDPGGTRCLSPAQVLNFSGQNSVGKNPENHGAILGVSPTNERPTWFNIYQDYSAKATQTTAE